MSQVNKASSGLDPIWMHSVPQLQTIKISEQEVVTFDEKISLLYHFPFQVVPWMQNKHCKCRNIPGVLWREDYDLLTSPIQMCALEHIRLFKLLTLLTH